MEYQTDEERLEAVKRWWRENARFIIGGLVLGGAVAAGWWSWQDHQARYTEQASSYYDAMMGALQQNDYDEALGRSRELMSDYSRSAYAALAAMAAARIEVERGEVETALDHLRWAVDNARTDSKRAVARMRLARLYLMADDPGAALAQMEQLGPVRNASAYHELMGDIYRARGDRERARAAYRDALEVMDDNGGRFLVEMKLAELGPAQDKGN